MWCQSTVPIPMGHFAKIKILEVSTMSWQYTGWSLAYLQRCEFGFWYVSGVNECNWSWKN